MSQKNIFRSNNPPDLPLDKFNHVLTNYQGKLRTVRTQEIKLPAQPHSTISIARIKIPAPDKISCHLIKRFDTNAVSASSFFRSAFPHASEEEEAVQMAYLQQIYDTRSAGAFGSERKLTGVWVPLENASELAEEYGIARFAAPLLAVPQPITSPVSPTATKTTAENDSSAILTPKPKQTDQTQATRSSKRSRAGPLSFASTSPSTFNLSTLSKPPAEAKKASSHGPRPTPAEKPASPTDPAAARGQETEPAKTTTPSENSALSSVAGHQLIGSDEVAEKAKQDALKLVADLKSSQASAQPAAESPVKSTETGAKKPSPTQLNRKRSVDAVSAEDDDDDDDAGDNDDGDGDGDGGQGATTERRSFLPKLLWRRATRQTQPHAKKPKRNQPGSAAKAFVQLSPTSADSLVDQPLSPLTPNKRNLAIAGIVIAGAAASIAPYFF